MINITEIALEKIKQNLDRRKKGKGIRLGVRPSGCAGLAYVLEYVDEITPDLDNFLFNDVSIFINKHDQIYLAGLTMDYIKKGLNEGFEFINPNESSRCGCNESFTPK